MADGLPSHLGDIGSESIVDGGIATADLADGQVSNAKLAASAASGTKVSSEYATVKLGSPAAVGNSMLMIDGVTGAGSSVWQTFEGHTFGAAPKAVVSARVDGTGWLSVSGVSTGSALVLSETASTKFTLFVVGSGR